MTTSRYTYRPRHAAPRQPIPPLAHALIMAAFAVVLAVLFPAPANAVPPDPSWDVDTCEALDANALTDTELAEVLHLGYMGSPSDGADLLYPPQCLPADAQLMAQDGPTGCTYLTVPDLTMEEQLNLIAAGWEVDVYEDGSAHAFDPQCLPSFV